LDVPDEVTITFLGGLGDIGRNCAVIEASGEALLLDCGQLFPDESMPGADSVLPDLGYLDDKGDRIVGCITTHGHEDHIGALAHLLARFEFPIYGSAFTIGMVRNRLGEAGLLGRTELRPVGDNERRRIGSFDCEFLPVTHSVPRGLISAITTPQGVILHSSDFKLDLDPVDGRLTDLTRIGAIADDPGIRLLLCDSTNADVPGRSASESEIGPVFEHVFRESRGRRVIAACFSSHVHRVQQMVAAALADGRKVATLGMSMKRNVTLARELGLLTLPDNRVIDIEDVDAYPPGEVCVVSTGSQAEARSALALAAFGDSRWIDIGVHDTVVLSSHPIPGNEARVGKMIDELTRSGARVLHTSHLGLHTSGHGKQDELRVLHSVARADWFVPVHGEYRHLVAHAELAERMGTPSHRILVATDGDQVRLGDTGAELVEKVTPGSYVFVHGDLTEDDHDVFRERLILGDEGVVVATVTVSAAGRSIVAGPVVESRGWLGSDNFHDITSDAVEELRKALLVALEDDDELTSDLLERRVRRAVGGFVSRRTGRRPMIIPVVALI
jgi:ribonuclease J